MVDLGANNRESTTLTRRSGPKGRVAVLLPGNGHSFVHIDDGLHGTMIKSNAKKPSAFMLVSKKPLAEGLLLATKKKATIFSRTFQLTENSMWAWLYPRKNKPKVLASITKLKHPDAKFLIFKSYDTMDKFLAEQYD